MDLTQLSGPTFLKALPLACILGAEFRIVCVSLPQPMMAEKLMPPPKDREAHLKLVLPSTSDLRGSFCALGPLDSCSALKIKLPELLWLVLH